MPQVKPDPDGGHLNFEAGKVGLPARPFLYTLDQISTLLNVNLQSLKKEYVFFEGRSIGFHNKHLLAARNIAPPTKSPDWRVAERELVRWMRLKGFRYYERASIKS